MKEIWAWVGLALMVLSLIGLVCSLIQSGGVW